MVLLIVPLVYLARLMSTSNIRSPRKAKEIRQRFQLLWQQPDVHPPQLCLQNIEQSNNHSNTLSLPIFSNQHLFFFTQGNISHVCLHNLGKIIFYYYSVWKCIVLEQQQQVRLFSRLAITLTCFCFKAEQPCWPQSQTSNLSLLLSKVVEENPVIPSQALGKFSPSPHKHA